MKNRRASTNDARATGNAAGSTLIEVLVATVIMGSAVIVLVTGMGTLFSSAIQNRQATSAGVVARSYGEALEVAATQSGAWCSASYTVPYTPPAGFTVTATYGACPANDATTPQFQTATISATTPLGATEQLRMVVRES